MTSVLSIRKMRETAIVPVFDEKHQYVIYCPEDIVITPNKTFAIPLGIQVSFPSNYAGLVVNYGSLDAIGGLVDSDFRGEIHVLVTSEKEIKLTRGQPIGSLILIEIEHPEIDAEESLSSSDVEEECNMSFDK